MSQAMSDFNPSKTFEEAHERAEHAEHAGSGGGRHGARWVPIAAAIIAVVAAFSNLVASQRSTLALVAKNEALRMTTLASDAYNEYESHSLKQYIYEATLASGNVRVAAPLQTIVAKQKREKKPVLAKARDYEREAAAANEESAHKLHSYETMEIGITFLEIAIVLVSISALATTRILTVIAAIAVIAGVVITAYGAVFV